MSKTEITWSLMHPTKLDAEYMKRVIAEADSGAWQVDSFELCAACHSELGGLNGLVLFDEYPQVAATLDREGILKNIERFREIVDLAHASGRPLYYWHREATVWPELLKIMPDLMDCNGEFDLLGAAYEKLLRYKIVKAFEAVPQLDGLVLTLTEADFSTIHNSTPEIYPPEKVAARLISIFADELKKLDRHLILRSFGSIAEDYEQILEGAAIASADYQFEVETKITPYDFDPFLPDNPFLKKLPRLSLGAECDSLGEFLGAGYLPAENVENIVRYVRWAQKCGVDRYAIRLDRIGNNIFDAYPINLYAYEQAIRHPELTAGDIRRNYAEEHYPKACREQLIALGKDGFEATAKIQYVDHHVIFHQCPPSPVLKYLKAGGFFTLFQPGRPLADHSGIWSILFNQTTPSREAILREKDEGLALARRSLARVEDMKEQLSPEEYCRLHRLWSNAVVAGQAERALSRATAAYFDDMDRQDEAAPALTAAVREMESTLIPLLENCSEVEIQGQKFVNGMEHWQLGSAYGVEDIFVKPFIGIVRLLLEEFPCELAARRRLQAMPGVIDFAVPGGIYDEIRCVRFMHACHGLIRNGAPCRLIGNQVFPNGFLKIRFSGRADAPLALHLKGEGRCQIEVNGVKYCETLDEDTVLKVASAESLEVVFRKQGAEYPVLYSCAVCAE